MEILVTEKPHILLEAVELLYAYVNEAAPETLTAQGEYCLPVEAVREMMEVVCGGIDRKDSLVEYYFGKHPLLETPGKYTCLARNLMYIHPFLSNGNINEDYQRIRELRRLQLSSGIRFDGITEFCLTLCVSEDSRYIPLAKDLFLLNVEQEYAQMLLEQFSNFDEAMTRLETILTPATERLSPILEKWAVRAKPLAKAWREHLEDQDFLPLLCGWTDYRENPESISSIHMQIRYLLPSGSFKVNRTRRREIFVHVGAAIKMERCGSDTFESWEFEALRLLGSEVRVRMLRLMLDSPMSARELTRALGLHLGTVCRDINSMYGCNLLLLVMVNDRKKYRTNMETIETLTKHMLQLNKFNAL